MAYSTITKPSDYFNTKLYTGNGSTNAITGVGFQPDFVWIKDRSGTNNHELNDAVRGANHQVFSNLTNAETTPTNHLNAFNSDGFTLGNDGSVNTNSSNYCSWNWKANGAGSSNTDGSITSSVSANTTSGFSIVSYTGTGANATVGHGLGSKPKFIIIKSRDKVDNWHCYHESIGATKVIWLDLTSASASTSPFMQDTEPTSSVFSLGNNTAVNTSGFDHIAYCFAEKQGYSKFGSYTGNGNADGTFVYTGFKPSWVMVKQTNASGNSWHIKDNKRSSFNVVDDSIYANMNIAEVANNSALNTDFLSNGFKLKNTDGSSNGGGASYIYMAFAEEPLVASNDIPATAR
nr:hypothetical protein [uncultured Mediterranean phage uvMED]BAR15312.1 hypothetical protein [uncultured Mediterranean phage uvMED]